MSLSHARIENSNLIYRISSNERGSWCEFQREIRHNNSIECGSYFELNIKLFITGSFSSWVCLKVLIYIYKYIFTCIFVCLVKAYRLSFNPHVFLRRNPSTLAGWKEKFDTLDFSASLPTLINVQKKSISYWASAHLSKLSHIYLWQL